MPAYGRHHTSQLLKIKNQCFLIDCGESTQTQLSRYNGKLNQIAHIFISHLHGDHYLGLMALLSSMHLMNRKKPLRLYGHKGLSEIISLQLKYSHTVFNYEIDFVELDPKEPRVIFENDELTVETIPLRHRISCTGFLFKEKPKPRRLNKERLPKNLSLENIARLKKGEDALDDNGDVLFTNEALTLPARPSRAYAYCSDTIYYEDIIPQIRGVDLLYHEATFLEEDAEKAAGTFHSTAKQAASIAKQAEVGTLVIGHFSARYKELDEFLTEAQSVFERTSLAIEGEAFEIKE